MRRKSDPLKFRNRLRGTEPVKAAGIIRELRVIGRQTAGGMDICLNGYPERIDDICASLDDHHRIAGRRNGKLAKIRADGECANCRRRVRQCNKFSWLATERRAPIAGASLIINYHLAGVIEDRRTGHGRVAFKRQISQIGTAIKRIGSDIGNATTNGYLTHLIWFEDRVDTHLEGRLVDWINIWRRRAKLDLAAAIRAGIDLVPVDPIWNFALNEIARQIGKPSSELLLPKREDIEALFFRRVEDVCAATEQQIMEGKARQGNEAAN